MERSGLEPLRQQAKADLAAASLGEAVQLCIAATGYEFPVTTVSAEVPAMRA